MNVTCPKPGDIAFPADPRGRGHYVVVVAAEDDWVLIRAHYPGDDEAHERKIRLSTYLTRYET